MMRSVSFVDRLELDFSGNHFSGALTLGDVDSDGLNELVIGNVEGELAVFKGDRSPRPWRRCAHLGTITSVAIGDLYNKGKNVLVAISAKGTCYVFVLDSDNNSGSPTATPRASGRAAMKPSHSQDLQAHNVKVMLIDSIAPGGYHDLFVGRTDRGVDVFRWREQKNTLQLRERVTLAGQIGSLCVTTATGGSSHLLVSQPGGTYVPLCYNTDEMSPLPAASKGKTGLSSLVQLPMVGQPQRRNPTGSTEMVGQIISQSDQQAPTGREGGAASEIPSVAMEMNGERRTSSSVVALCTLDGSIRMLRNETKQWELQVDHSLFAIEKLDITGDGDDEIVVCAWDGMTYIVDQARNVVRFQFEENVSAFCAGHFGMLDGSNRPCLIYTTFSNKIYVYHNISLPSIPASNLLLEMANKELPEELKQTLEGLTDAEKQKLFQRCLYSHQDSPVEYVVKSTV